MVAPSSWQITLSFLRIGVSAFGGGMAALPVFEAELDKRRGWLTRDDITGAYTLAQSIPGVIIINFAVLTGYRLAGKRGAAWATLAVIQPAFFVILALAILLDGQWNNKWVEAVLSGLRPAVIALLAAAAIRLATRFYRSPPAVAAAIATAVLMFCFNISPVWFILVGILVGTTAHALHLKRSRP